MTYQEILAQKSQASIRERSTLKEPLVTSLALSTSLNIRHARDIADIVKRLEQDPALA